MRNGGRGTYKRALGIVCGGISAGAAGGGLLSGDAEEDVAAVVGRGRSLAAGARGARGSAAGVVAALEGAQGAVVGVDAGEVLAGVRGTRAKIHVERGQALAGAGGAE